MGVKLTCVTMEATEEVGVAVGTELMTDEMKDWGHLCSWSS